MTNRLVGRVSQRAPRGTNFVPVLIVSLLALTQSTLAATPQSPPEVSPPSGEYTIGAGDVLRIFVWKEPELSQDVTVRLDGKTTAPLIGDILALGRTPADLAKDLRQAYGRFIASPNVTIEVKQPVSARFYVIGQVARPGEFPLTGRITILQGLAIAGGFGAFAKTEEIVILRNQDGVDRFLPVDYKKLLERKDATHNVVLRPGDTILVP